MKFLYCILALCVVANAEPVPPTKEQLESLIELLLQNVRDAPESIAKTVATTLHIVEAKLLENKVVRKAQINLEEKLDPYIQKGENIPEDLLNCSVVFLNGYQDLAKQVNNELLQKFTTEKYGKHGDYLATLKKELSEIHDALENHADQEIETCIAGKSKCKLTDEFLSKSEEFFTFQDLMKPALTSSVESSNDYFDSEEIGNKIVVNISHPSYECLNNLSQ